TPGKIMHSDSVVSCDLPRPVDPADVASASLPRSHDHTVRSEFPPGSGAVRSVVPRQVQLLVNTGYSGMFRPGGNFRGAVGNPSGTLMQADKLFLALVRLVFLGLFLGLLRLNPFTVLAARVRMLSLVAVGQHPVIRN